MKFGVAVRRDPVVGWQTSMVDQSAQECEIEIMGVSFVVVMLELTMHESNCSVEVYRSLIPLRRSKILTNWTTPSTARQRQTSARASNPFPMFTA